ncbi:MAG: NAD-dependent epimerase/dehydratase family protein [Acidimicrobiia bacterium]|nr:MAG: NAD-dependent epimerase/dehydratase family protein [Acidimicrobiia bacterium]
MASHVIFGTGPVGMALAAQLAAAGEQVTAVNRSGNANAPDGIEIVGGDVSDPGFTSKVVGGAAVVYQCLNPPYTKWPELFPPLQVAVVEAATAAGAKLVSFENLYMYGPTGGAPLTEDLPYAATGAKGRVRAQMAQDLLAAHEAGRLRVAIGRAADYFGPGGLVSQMGARVFYPVLAGKNAQVMGDPDQPHTFSYIPDIAAGLVTLGSRDEADGRAWHLPNAPTITTRDFVDKITEAAGTDSSVSPMPPFMVNLVALFNGNVREIKEVLYQLEEPFVVDSTAFESTFDQRATPLNESIPNTVDWFRAHPK